jgi:hypothetical protein
VLLIYTDLRVFILMHDQDGRSTLRISVGSNSTNLDGTKLMVVNASDIDGESSR